MLQVTSADVNDRPALDSMLSPLAHKFKTLKKLWADMGYQSKNLKEKASICDIDLEVVRRPPTRFWVPGNIKNVEEYLKSCGIDISGGFKVLPRCWVVERTFAWIGRYRRMSKDYEFLPHTQETFMYLALTKTMLKRLVKCQNLI
jgi:putative transposase